MAKLANRVQSALDEARILVLGGTILLGFGYRSFFEREFSSLPEWARWTKLVTLCLMLVMLALVMLPGPFHRLVEKGEDTERVHRVATSATAAALLPFAIALGLDVLVALVRVEDLALRAALGIAGAVCALAILFWYVVPAARRRAGAQENEMERSSVDKKIRHVLTEARMILPGAQAILGFQLAVTLMEAFRELPREAQLVHGGGMLLTAVAVVLLMAPAAYHRIAEGGEETERFQRVAGGFVVAALVPLALSMSAELGVVAYRLTERVRPSVAIAAAALVFLLGAWFGFALVARAVVQGRREPAHA